MCDSFKDPVRNVHFQESTSFVVVDRKKKKEKRKEVSTPQHRIQTYVVCGAHHSGWGLWYLTCQSTKSFM